MFKITATCKTVFHLRNVSKIHTFLTLETTKTIVHAFVTSKLDYCNFLLYDQPKYMLKTFNLSRTVLPDSLTCQVNMNM